MSAFLGAIFVCSCATAADFYAAPIGSPSGNGSIQSPWDLQTALNQPSSVHAGDTIWLRGGTYSGIFKSYLSGTPANPIVVRQYPAERATIDSGNSSGNDALVVYGSYVWFWGFELMSSDPNRVSAQAGPWPTDIGRGAMDVYSQAGNGLGVKFINLIVHDLRGSGLPTTSLDSEFYGCLMYYNGWNAPDGGHGHALYIQNQTGAKTITDNIVFQQFSHGLHAYTENSYIDNITVQGNTFFKNGSLSNSGPARNVLIGSTTVVTHNPVVANNYMYYPHNNQPASSFYLGYTAGCSNATVTDNYLANNTYFPHCAPSAMTGNTFYGNTVGFTASQYPNNTYYSSRPTGTKVFIRPNAYEFGRANITVFNWDNAATVSVDLTGVAYAGGSFQIRNAQDFFGEPVASGVFDGSPVTLPMIGLSTAAPVGLSAPPPTGPEFNAFILLSLPGPNEYFDVAPGNPFHDSIVIASAHGITVGCGNGDYCPGAPVRRDQMAVFLLKGEHGAAYEPPAALGTVFNDVPASAFAAAWIEEAKAEGVASGCGGGRFCPSALVSRAQMAVLLLKSRLGSSYVPPAATGTVFSDVSSNDFAAAWIEDLSRRGISSGCGGGKYCPTSSVTRAQMAALLVKTFALQ